MHLYALVQCIAHGRSMYYGFKLTTYYIGPMINTIANKYLQRITKELEISDYAISKRTGIPTTTLSAARRGVQKTFGIEHCHAIAELLDIDPMIIVAEMNVANAKSKKVKEYWKQILSTAAGVLFSFSFIAQPVEASVVSAEESDLPFIYYAHLWCKRYIKMSPL